MKRPWYLTLVLIIGSLSSFGLITLPYQAAFHEEINRFNNDVPIFYFLASAAGVLLLISIILLWRWKKLGLYIYLPLAIIFFITILVADFVGKASAFQILGSLFRSAITLLILPTALMSSWKRFK